MQSLFSAIVERARQTKRCYKALVLRFYFLEKEVNFAKIS